ncbi:hypothetical protein BKA93DRAFT_926862 [Sparassis latifolia]
MTISLYDQEQTDQDLLSYFDKSASAVRQSFKHFEQEYARPALNYFLEFSRSRPILATFLGVFSTFSVLPVLSFLGFSLFVFASCIFFSLAGALFVATTIVLLSGLLLVGTLTILFFLSLFLTACAMGIYLSLRFAVLINKDGPRTGVPEWYQETKKSLLASQPGEDADASGHQPNEYMVRSDSETLIFDSFPTAPMAQAEADKPGAEVPEGDLGKDMVVVVKEE